MNQSEEGLLLIVPKPVQWAMVERPGFVPPMECLRVPKLPDGRDWSYELELDGYRLVAARNAAGIALYSRNGNLLNRKYPAIVDALQALPADTIIDGELVALDDAGRPAFNLLQKAGNESSRIRYFSFDVMRLRGRELVRVPLAERREILIRMLPANERIRISEIMHTSASTLLSAVRAQGLEGVVAKRKDSFYEAGSRSGAWQKMRINLGQEFVIGGYMPGAHGVESLIVGVYRDAKLQYVARVKNGFVPASRRAIFSLLHPLVVERCPFVNLPEAGKGRWGEPLTAEKMRKCVWTRPKLIAQISFLEWTPGDHLRHSNFEGIREDKNPRAVVRE
jgi:bifunctional non-homologous end joining protein LigD